MFVRILCVQVCTVMFANRVNSECTSEGERYRQLLQEIHKDKYTSWSWPWPARLRKGKKDFGQGYCSLAFCEVKKLACVHNIVFWIMGRVEGTLFPFFVFSDFFESAELWFKNKKNNECNTTRLVYETPQHIIVYISRQQISGKYINTATGKYSISLQYRQSVNLKGGGSIYTVHQLFSSTFFFCYTGTFWCEKEGH